jgi:ketosteroid isomerase-like protein
MTSTFSDRPTPVHGDGSPLGLGGTTDLITYETEAACRRLIVAFAHHIDRREFDRVAALFTEDGVWDRHGERLEGPDQILAQLEGRPPTQIERHVMTNIHVSQESPDECSATSYLTLFRAEAEPGRPAEVEGPVGIGEFHDRFRLTDTGWKISFRTVERVFVRPT